MAPSQSPRHQVASCYSSNLGTEEVQNQICFQYPLEHIPTHKHHCTNKTSQPSSSHLPRSCLSTHRSVHPCGQHKHTNTHTKRGMVEWQHKAGQYLIKMLTNGNRRATMSEKPIANFPGLLLVKFNIYYINFLLSSLDGMQEPILQPFKGAKEKLIQQPLPRQVVAEPFFAGSH